MHAARHQVVARAFRRRLRQHRGLDFQKLVLVEESPDGHRRLVAQLHVLLHPPPPQVEVAVAQPDIFRDRAVLGNLERRGRRVVEHADLPRRDLHHAGLQLRVDGVLGPPLGWPQHRHDVLGPQPLRCREERRVVARHDLRHAVPVAHVHEDQRAEIAHAVHPSQQDDLLADIGFAQRPARVGASQVSESTDRSRPRLVAHDADLSASTTFARATACCSPVAIVFTVTSPRASSSPPTMTTWRAPVRWARLNCALALRAS